MVILYRGLEGDPGVTEAGQAALQDLFDEFPASPVCGIQPGTSTGPVIARFDDMATPYAALLWGRVLPLERSGHDADPRLLADLGRADQPGEAVRDAERRAKRSGEPARRARPRPRRRPRADRAPRAPGRLSPEPGQDRLRRAELPRPRRGGRPGRADPAAAVRQVPQRGHRQRRTDRPTARDAGPRSRGGARRGHRFDGAARPTRGGTRPRRGLCRRQRRQRP